LVLKGFMGPSLVVLFHSFFYQGSYFSDIGKEVSIENGFAVDSVKPFDLTLCIGIPS
jgi:hypothetical protein